MIDPRSVQSTAVSMPPSAPVEFSFNGSAIDKPTNITMDLRALERTKHHEQDEANDPHYPTRTSYVAAGAILGLAVSGATAYLNMLAFQIRDEQDARRREEEDLLVDPTTQSILR